MNKKYFSASPNIYRILVIIIIITFIWLFFVMQEVENERLRVTEDLSNYLNNYTMMVEKYLSQVQIVFEVLKSSKEIKNIDAAGAQSLLSELNSIEIFDNILIYNILGEAIAAKAELDNRNLSDCDYFKLALSGENVISKVKTCVILNEEVLYYYTPIKKDYEIVGVMIGVINISNIRDRLASLPANDDWEVVLTDKMNDVVYFSGPELAKSDLESLFFIKNEEVSLVNNPSLIDMRFLNDEHFIIAAKRIPDFDWTVAILHDAEKIKKAYISLIINNITYYLLAIMIVLFFYYILQKNSLLEERYKLQEHFVAMEKMETVSQMAAAIAHELRNPLTSIRGFVQLALLRQKQLDPQVLEVMESDLHRMEGIINEFMEMAKPIKREIKKFELQQVLKQCCLLMEPYAENKEVMIIKESGADKFLLGDEAAIKQVLINLIKNAIEAVDSRTGWLRVKAEQKDSCAVISIIDNGSGFPKQIVNDIGKPFITTKEKGTGLGLLISKQIIETAGGSLSISRQDNLTIVKISLPLNC
ncbi:MAG: sensor histidine kinase [Bacillota bacterium]|nr:sensor histidine kinase [Bacillota bacterium]